MAEWDYLIESLVPCGVQAKVVEVIHHPAFTVTLHVSGTYVGTWAGTIKQFQRFVWAVTREHLPC